MTIKEIEKIIDESDCYWLKRGDWKLLCTLNHEWTKGDLKRQVMCTIGNGYSYVFIKLNDNGEAEKTWKIDHIDKKTKVIKKKLDEMTKQEIIQVRDRICGCRKTCNGCSFAYSDKDNICKNMCDINFSWWKERYENLKDREFDVEVEE